MKVFISWSGGFSHRVAVVLREWLPCVLQAVVPYVSSEDIDKGARWSTDISKELEESSYGILCVTRDNVQAPWLNFEAGALSKEVDKSRVSPFLFGVKRSSIKGPLLQFQSTVFSKSDVCKLVHSINTCCETPCLEEARLENGFAVWWPRLKEALDALASEVPEEKREATDGAASTSSEILEELLELVRSQQKRLNSPPSLLPKNYLVEIMRHARSEEGFQLVMPKNHPVFTDLLECYNAVQHALVTYKDQELPTGLMEAMENIGPPLRYLLRKCDANTSK